MKTLQQISTELDWILKQIKCLLGYSLSATAWSPNHNSTTGNKYAVHTLVWWEGYIYHCRVANNSVPVNNGYFWDKVGEGRLLDEEQADWDSTGGASFIRNKPILLGTNSQNNIILHQITTSTLIGANPLEELVYFMNNVQGKQLFDTEILLIEFTPFGATDAIKYLFRPGKGNYGFGYATPVTTDDFIDLGSSGGSVTWTLLTANEVGELGRNYLTNNATKIEVTLPNDNTNRIIKLGSILGGWKIIIPIGWEVLISDEIITTELESTLDSDYIELLSLGNSKYRVLTLNGNINYTN